MREALEGLVGNNRSARRWASLLALACAVPAIALGSASPALASSSTKELFAKFDDCPVLTAAVCTVAYTTGGEFVIGNKTVPIEQTITLQGGLAVGGLEGELETQPLIAPAKGETLSKTPLTVPGGLVGIAGLGGEVTATAELVGPASSVTVNAFNILVKQPSVTLPIKVKLSNPILGEECYIGSDAEPIVLHLTTGKTSPPPPATSISGSNGVEEGIDKGKIKYIDATLVDNDFAVPGATGCGGALSPVVDLAVDADVGIPSSAGSSTAIMKSTLYETTAELAKKYIPKEKKAKK